MERSTIRDQVNKIFVETLGNEDIILLEATTANDIEEWDSLTHMQLVVAIEEHFKFRFTSKEIQSWANIGEMIDSVSKRILA